VDEIDKSLHVISRIAKCEEREGHVTSTSVLSRYVAAFKFVNLVVRMLFWKLGVWDVALR